MRGVALTGSIGKGTHCRSRKVLSLRVRRCSVLREKSTLYVGFVFLPPPKLTPEAKRLQQRGRNERIFKGKERKLLLRLKCGKREWVRGAWYYSRHFYFSVEFCCHEFWVRHRGSQLGYVSGISSSACYRLWITGYRCGKGWEGWRPAAVCLFPFFAGD